ncbi:hypothetical protein IG631_14347 [Alternaria alternata]|nr:hypothetical protein IG631_14347 [Alternaria alternata]
MGFVRDTYRALSIDELLWLLSTDEHPASPSSRTLYKWTYVSSCCYGLIEDDGFGNVVFIHRLILQCLEDPDYSGKVRVQHEEFAKRCLFYLKYVDLSEGACLDSISFDARLNQLPLFDYAARYWHHHVKCSLKNNSHPDTETPMSGCISSIVRNFLDEDAQVEATFQVSLFPPRNPQSYLDRVVKDITWTEAKLQLMMIEKKITFDPFQPNRMTGLHVACEHEFEEIAYKYIQKKKNYEQPLNDTNIHRCTPLHYAVRGKHLRITKVLLDAGANINCWDIWGVTPLVISLIQLNLPMAKLLLEPERTDLNVNAQTAHVMEFKEHNYKVLLHDGTPDVQDDVVIRYSVSGRTALHYVARNGMEEIVQLLLTTRKVDCTLQDSAGQLAWHKAAKYGHAKILPLLLAQGIHPLSRIGETRNGVEPDPKIKEYDGHLNTALHVAAKWSQPEVVSYLVDSFPDIVPLQNDLGETALTLAIVMRDVDMVDLLLRKSFLKGVDACVNIEDKAKRRPIHQSVYDRSGKCMRLLLSYEGIELDVKDTEDRTPLDFAAEYGYPCHIEQLLKLDVYVEKGCEQWRKALDHAYKRLNWSIYRALFSSKKINDLLDADYAKLKDMVLSVSATSVPPEDLDEAISKIYCSHLNKTGEPSVPNAQSSRESRCQTIGTDDETETPLAERVPEFSPTLAVQGSEGTAEPVDDELHPESRISTAQSRAASPYPMESIELISASGTGTLYKPQLAVKFYVWLMPNLHDGARVKGQVRLPDLRQSSAIRALLIAPDMIGPAKRSPSACSSKLPKECTARNTCFGRLECIFHGNGGFFVRILMLWDQLRSLGRQSTASRQSWAVEGPWKGMELFGIFSRSAQPVHLQHPGYYF